MEIYRVSTSTSSLNPSQTNPQLKGCLPDTVEMERMEAVTERKETEQLQDFVPFTGNQRLDPKDAEIERLQTLLQEQLVRLMLKTLT